MVIEKPSAWSSTSATVVILLDSITEALGALHKTVVPVLGKVLTGGVDANALQRRSASSAPPANIEEGGSLTSSPPR